MVGSPIHLSGSPARRELPPPRLGEHTEATKCAVDPCAIRAGRLSAVGVLEVDAGFRRASVQRGVPEQLSGVHMNAKKLKQMAVRRHRWPLVPDLQLGRSGKPEPWPDGDPVRTGRPTGVRRLSGRHAVRHRLDDCIHRHRPRRRCPVGAGAGGRPAGRPTGSSSMAARCCRVGPKSTRTPVG